MHLSQLLEQQLRQIDLRRQQAVNASSVAGGSSGVSRLLVDLEADASEEENDVEDVEEESEDQAGRCQQRLALMTVLAIGTAATW